MQIPSAIESLLDVVGSNLTPKAQQLQNELAYPARLLLPLSLYGLMLMTLGHVHWEVVSPWICLHL